MRRESLGAIDEVVGDGRAVVTGADEEIVTLVKRAIEDDRTVSFYLSQAQARAIREWYWTPERIEQLGLRPISDEEAEKIRAELGVEITNFRYAPMECDCGRTYGAFDFLQQGIRTHGLEAVNAVFSLKNSTFLQVNPTFVSVCPECERELSRNEAGGGWYDCDQYGGCCCCASLAFASARV